MGSLAGRSPLRRYYSSSTTIQGCSTSHYSSSTTIQGCSTSHVYHTCQTCHTYSTCPTTHTSHTTRAIHIVHTIHTIHTMHAMTRRASTVCLYSKSNTGAVVICGAVSLIIASDFLLFVWFVLLILLVVCSFLLSKYRYIYNLSYL